jgi:DNA polymerase-3 subunit epsilon
MREIVLDTETTGLNPAGGDRVVEIGGVELVNHIPTGDNLHLYINPERDMPAEAFAVHGLSAEFLAGYPVFADIADQLVEFVADSKLIIHNASFDMGFLNHELEKLGREPIPYSQAVDSLMLARRRHPGGPNSLDALCDRYGIDNSRRDKHGALLDAELLAEVYIELIGGRQAMLTLVETETRSVGGEKAVSATRPVVLPPQISDAEKAAHTAFIAKMGTDAIWRKYREIPEE